MEVAWCCSVIAETMAHKVIMHKTSDRNKCIGQPPPDSGGAGDGAGKDERRRWKEEGHEEEEDLKRKVLLFMNLGALNHVKTVTTITGERK